MSIVSLAGLCLQRRDQPLVREERRIDAAREVAQILDRLPRRGLEVREHRLRLLGIAVDEPFGQAELHRERDELLLRAVVEVALELAPLLVLGVDQPLA